MRFQNSLLSTADQATLAAAIAGIPAVLNPLSAALTQAQTTGATALSLAAQVQTLQAEQAAMTAPGGGYGPQDPAVQAVTSQLALLATPILNAEQAAATVNQNLYAACQACNGLLHTLLPVALRQATAEVMAALAPFYANGAPDVTVASNTGLHVQLHYTFGAAAGPTPNRLAQTVAIATGLQTLLQAIQAGTAIVPLG